MSAGKIFGFLKKGAKKAGKGKKKGDKKQAVWPSGTRVGVVGHTNAGKTCYFTVLNECSKTDKHLQVSVSDHTTAAEFLANYRSIWGLATAVSSGTAVDLRGEQKFPDPTAAEKVIQFSAILDRDRKVSVVSYDYPGCAIDINEHGDMKDRVEDFFSEADGLLFFYDPKLLQAEIQNQSHVSSFVNVIEQIAPLGSKLPIPVALVVTKADILPGFTGEDQVMLVPTADESILAEDFEVFVQRVLDNERLQSNPKWAATVRELLLKLRDFLRVVVGRTLNFQIFFSSSMGTPPEKIGSDIGRSLYRPPRKIVPVGVREPMYWLLNAMVGNRRISRFRTVAKWAALLSFVWILLFSIPFAWHFWYSLPETQRIERDTLKPYDGSLATADPQQLRRISDAYGDYSTSFMVRQFFRSYRPPAERLRNMFLKYDVADSKRQLDEAITRFAGIVKNPTVWPAIKPADGTVLLLPEHERLLADLKAHNLGDSTSELYRRSGRALAYWDLFTAAIKSPGDVAGWNTAKEQVMKDQRFFANEISAGEKQLASAFAEHEGVETQKVIAEQTAGSVDRSFIQRINDDPRPEYRLEDARDELQDMLAKLGSADPKISQMIQKYLTDAAAWQKSRTYQVKVESLPEGAHVHIAVTDAGQEPKYELTQTFAGDAIPLQWKPGQNIHVALDVDGHCEWGKNPSDKVTVQGKYALFELEKGVSFPNVKKTATFRFDPNLTDRLPELK